MKHERVIEILAVVMITAVLIGEIVVYASSTKSFNVNADYDGVDNVHWSVSVSGSQPFSVIAMESTMQTMTELYVFYDARYASAYEVERGPIGSRPVDQRFYIDQLLTALAYASGMPVRILSADDLKTAMDDDVAGVNVLKGLVVISGALPDVIYQGNPADLIFDWLAGGGRLYWLGNILGKYCSTPSGIVDVSLTEPNYQALFFGAGANDCLNTDASGTGFVSHDFKRGPIYGLRDDLSLKNNRVKYAMDTTKLDAAGVNYRAVGFSDDNAYASVVLAEYGGGKGMICVLAGDYSRNQRSDLVQIVSSGICYSTNVLGTAHGSVRYGTSSGDIDVTGAAMDVTAYVCLGGYYPVYGRLFSFP
jgi:hypothetical protein